MPRSNRRERDRERRITVERHHQMADAAEQYEINLARATSHEERHRLMTSFAAFRTAHRLEDIERGTRQPGTSVMMQQALWSTWATIAGEQLQRAREEYGRIAAGDTTALASELRASMLAICASAATIEAVYEDLVYLVPRRSSDRQRYEQVVDLLQAALGLDEEAVSDLKDRLEHLFDARNAALHPYSELQVPRPHPAGVTATGAEHSIFNAVQAEAAVATALAVIDLAASPPRPAGRWVSRWCEEKRSYFSGPISDVRASVSL